MAKEIIWSIRAQKSFERVVEYLKQEWTNKEIKRFVSRTDRVLKIISEGNVIFRSSGKKDVYEVLITKHNLLLYRNKKTEIQLLVFFDTRQHPRKKTF